MRFCHETSGKSWSSDRFLRNIFFISSRSLVLIGLFLPHSLIKNMLADLINILNRFVVARP